MALNLYCTKVALKARLGIGASDTADDAILDTVIEAVSRQIDQHCGRWFYPVTQTRYYTARRRDRVLVDDLLAVTSIKTDGDGDRTYETTWAATDYDLEPVNAPNASPPEPYWEIRTTPEGAYSFPGTPRGVQVVGRWGYYDQRVTSTATANAIASTSATSITVSDGTAFEIGQTILIDSEQMYISGIATNTLTVARGVNGTTAATHAGGAAIQVYTYPIVSEAALFQAGLTFSARSAPTGFGGGGEFRTQIHGTGLHPFVRRMLAPLRRVIVG